MGERGLETVPNLELEGQFVFLGVWTITKVWEGNGGS